MKRHVLFLTAMFFLLFLLSCSLYEPTEPDTAPISDVSASTPEIVLPQNFSSETEKRAAALADDAILYAITCIEAHPVAVFPEKRFPQQAPRYDSLSDECREIYDMILYAVEHLEPYAWDSRLHGGLEGFSLFMTADNAVRSDYPETAMYYYPNVADDVYTPIYFLPGDNLFSPSEDFEELTARKALFDAVCRRITDCMPDGLSMYDSYRYFSLVIAQMCSYDNSQRTVSLPYPAYNALVNGSAVCSGYACAMQHLCRMAGLWCVRIDGTKDGGAHAWNTIWLDDYYYSDPTATAAMAPLSAYWYEAFVIPNETAQSEKYLPYKSVYELADSLPVSLTSLLPE